MSKVNTVVIGAGPQDLAAAAHLRGAGIEVRSSASNGHVSMELDDGFRREVGHVLLGTGYGVDVAKLPFLSAGVLGRLRRIEGFPILRARMESSVPRLHFVGAVAAGTSGPATRFVTGGACAARTPTRRALGKIPSPLTSSW